MQGPDVLLLYFFPKKSSGDADRFLKRNPEVIPRQVMKHPTVVVLGQDRRQSLATDDNDPAGIGKFFEAANKNLIKSGGVADGVNVSEHEYGRTGKFPEEFPEPPSGPGSIKQCGIRG
jgi:hypothetical protein